MRSVWLAILAGVAWATPAMADENDRGDRPDDEHEHDPILGDANPVKGTEAANLIAFTFDDGPKEKTTARVLDALSKYDVPGTFFVVTRRIVGRRSRERRALFDRIVADGHDIGAHTRSHRNLTTLTPAQIESEIDVSVRTITRVTGKPVGLFRPPYGVLDKTGVRHLKKRRLTDVRWNVDPKDFFQPKPKLLRTQVGNLIRERGGGVVLLHDTKLSTSRAIDGILDDLEGENCRRLEAGEEPIIPVSLHYFLRDGKKARAIPPEVDARTKRYREGLPDRCRARAAPEPASKSN
jgi:peptidoglycan/xylan/chitin deacetylase (PgdA/CDA1 family)